MRDDNNQARDTKKKKKNLTEVRGNMAIYTLS